MKTTITERKRAASRSGFTLVEVLVGIVLLAIMFTVFYVGITAGFGLIQLARENLRATQILQEKTEAIRLVTWDQLNTPGFIPTSFSDSFYPADGEARDGIQYRGTFRSSTPDIADAVYDHDIRRVTFELTWNSGGAERHRTMTTYVSRYGLYRYRY
jgi:prepilin-type N-terminal cleavage/methylation domain-containing protein